MILEVIATSVSDAIIAERNGAQRIELVSGFLDGGITPSYGLIEQVVCAVSIPVHVMVRPHANSFCYDAYDVETMLSDIRTIRGLQAAGIVLGALTLDDRIDEATMSKLLKVSDGLAVTFHRAFDEIADQLGALRTLSAYPQITRVLTSGGQPSVLNATARIQALIAAAAGSSIHILAGGGITVGTLDAFLSASGVEEVHMGSGVRQHQKPLAPLDPELVLAASTIMSAR
ncbi:MAG: copper homeostasis protein [Paenibacillus sp.]|jgi:copper homeostasis protein|nr:copper homeostasis protein [Paenibacillus sp.]